MKKILLLIILILSLSACQAPEQKSKTKQYEPLVIKEDKVVEEITKTKNIKIKYPVTNNDFVNIKLNEFSDKLKQEFNNFLIEEGIEYVNALDAKYTQYSFSDRVITYKFDIYTYTGGAHPNVEFKTLAFDISQQKLLEFKDLFKEDSDYFSMIVPIVRNKLKNSFGEKGIPIDDLFEQGTEGKPENYKNFALTDGGLIIFFPPYQIGPYAIGSHEAAILLQEIEQVLKSDYKL